MDVPREETEVGAREQPEDQGRHEIHPEPALDIPMITEDPEVIAEREGVHKRIKTEIQHEDTEAEMAEIPSEWNSVSDLIMEDEEELMITETDNKHKRDEVAQGQRKQWKEDDIGPEKCDQSPKSHPTTDQSHPTTDTVSPHH